MPSSQQHSQKICVLGATGSIGESTLSVIAQHPQQYQVFALTGHTKLERLAALVAMFKPEIVVVPAGKQAVFNTMLANQSPIKPLVLEGEEGLCNVAKHRDVDVVMAGIVGAAGLMPTLTAIEAGKRVLLANKEALVIAGDIFMQAAAQHHATLLPVDSEHNAIFQCLPQPSTTGAHTGLSEQGVLKLILTASGGPFRSWSVEQLSQVTPAQACKHPNWNMGRKISVDSATLMNKGLELIEACHLFALPESKIDVVIHPESVVHSLVQYVDGSTLAQLGNPDMCTPIAHALAWPRRVATTVKPLNLVELAQLNFFEPDITKFPCLHFARHAIQLGGTAPAVLNAANEVAVAAFLGQHLSFCDIPLLIEHIQSQITPIVTTQLSVVLDYDRQARLVANEWLYSHGMAKEVRLT